MITGEGDSSQLGGPVRIAKITGQVAEYGIIPFFSIMAYISISLGLINLFPFTMATQVLTETPYMFCIALLGFFASRYFFTRSLLFLICAVGATFLLTFVRVSGSTQFICLISGIIILIIHTRFKEGSFDRKLLIHSAIAVALFLFFTTIYNTTTSRSTKYSMPHFMFNWVYRSGTNIHYGGKMHGILPLHVGMRVRVLQASKRLCLNVKVLLEL